MTDDELNEIFRAIRHRRTLSWATIEKLANEVRDGRKPKTLKVQVPQYGLNRWGDLIQTTMFQMKPEDIPDLKGRIAQSAFMPTRRYAHDVPSTKAAIDRMLGVSVG